MSSLRNVLTAAAERLQGSSASAQTDAEYLLLHVLQKDYFWLRTHEQEDLSLQHVTQFNELLQRRLKGEPVAYLVGSRGFWSLELKINHHTLIPRPETELLVEAALEKIPPHESLKILDLGTGSGAIALAIKKERPLCAVTAVDASVGALQIAKENATALKLGIEFLHSDWFSALSERCFDVVLANPPYIAADDPHLQQGDLRFEPVSALASAAQGLQDIQRISAAAPAWLSVGGWLMLEHGYDQGEAVRKILLQNNFSEITTRRDLSGHERVTLGRNALPEYLHADR
jgi:release factor glutamine methyltransferase